MLGRNNDLPFLGRDMGSEPDYSDEVAKEIDDEIRRVIEEAHAAATAVLREHMEELHRLAAILIERETIDKDQFERLLAGEAEESVFPEEAPASVIEEPEAEKKPKLSAEAAPDPGHGDAAAPARPRALLVRPALRERRREDREERSNRGGRSQEVERDPTAPDRIREGEHDRPDEEGAETEQRDEAGSTQALTLLAGDALPLVERPVRELRREEEPDGDRRGSGVEGRVVERELGGVRAPCDGDGDRDERRPAVHEGREEHEERDHSGPGGHVPERSVAPGHAAPTRRQGARRRLQCRSLDACEP